MNRADRDERRNGFGLLRLMFASCVVASHAPELIDGNQDREALHALFGSLTLGSVGVYGFFLVSGYLVTQSLERSSDWLDFMERRGVRLYPAFLVASLVSLTIVAPLGGVRCGVLCQGEQWSALANIALLARPFLSDAFAINQFHDRTAALNGALYTIQYELLCYGLLLGSALIGALRHRRAAACTAVALVLVASTSWPDRFLSGLPHARLLPAPPGALAAMLAMFAVGSAFYLNRAAIPLRRSLALLAFGALVATLLVPALAVVGVALFGAYLVFYFALTLRSPALQAINAQTDISYGLYLYAWPVTQLLIYHGGGGSPLWVGIGTWVIAALLGWLSFIAVERPAMRYMRRSP